ncbi:MAG: hypothetical protein LUG95_07485 [Clostridiales bacterium]|nr:hypothetical protein [Clostridiales bacterium]
MTAPPIMMADTNKIKMKFAEFEFPSNPQTISVKTCSKTQCHELYSSDSVVQKICDKPTVISGSGKFFGDNAKRNCLLLTRLMKSKNSALLFARVHIR